MNGLNKNCSCCGVLNSGYTEIYNTSNLGNIAVYVMQPMFSETIFTPTVYMDGNPYEINWGETMLFNNLVLERYYTIEARAIRIGDKLFTPVLSSEWVQARKDDYEIVRIEYIETVQGNDMNYYVDYEEINRDGSEVVLNLMINNTGSDPIRNWKLDFVFGGNEQITSVWNGNYRQYNNAVSVTSNELGATIMPGTTTGIMMSIQSASQEIQLQNILVNGNAQINNQGCALVYVENPMFRKDIFVPEVRIGSSTAGEVESTTIMWGTAEQIGALPLNQEINVYAEEYMCDGIRYYPLIERENFTLDSTQPERVYIKYYQQELGQEIQYYIDYDLSNYATGFVCTVTITNLLDVDIEGWILNLEFLDNQTVDSFWSSEIIQDGNRLTVYPAEWNMRIVGNSSISFGFQGGNPGTINYPVNPVLNGASPNPRYTDLNISLARPAYPIDSYTPTITVDGEAIQIEYGQTVTTQVLAQSVHRIQASSQVGEERAFLSNFADVLEYAVPDEPLSINIEYYEALNNPSVFSAYFASWADFGANVPEDTQIATVAPYVTYMPIAFAKPYMEYNGSEYDMNNIQLVTGIETPYSGEMWRAAINLLKKASPYVKILLSLGGETYNNWDGLNPDAIARFIQDFGLDGVDIDFEEDIGGANCELDMETGLVSCTTDDRIISIIRALRAVLPASEGYIISFSAWSVGAYGEGQFIEAPPAHLTTTGVMLTPLREAGNDMELMNVMAYNAVVVGQPPYNPEQAGEAYKFYFPSGISAIGAHVPPDPQGTEYWTAEQTGIVARYARDQQIGGMMMWYLQRQGDVPGSNNVDLAEAIRLNLGFPEYPGPLYKGAPEA